MCAYLSKSENECREMKTVAYTFTYKREHSIQECVYHTLSRHWLGKTFTGIAFTNSNC